MKIDAPTDELAARINKPSCGYHVSDIVEGLKRFNGDYILQTMFLKAPDFDSSSPEVLDGWMEIVRELSPREVMRSWSTPLTALPQHKILANSRWKK